MSWILKHKKTKKIMEFSDGDVVEVIEDGRWQAGEVTHYTDNGEHYYVSIFGLGTGTANIDDPTLRRGRHANQVATKYYTQEIQRLKDKINHVAEKNEIKELEKKIKKLAPTNTKYKELQ